MIATETIDIYIDRRRYERNAIISQADSCILELSTVNYHKRNELEQYEEAGHRTSLIRAVVSCIAVGVVENERPQKRLHTKDLLSMMSFTNVSNFSYNGFTIGCSRLTGAPRQAEDATDYR